jgi:hypothetical protein
MHQQRSCEQAAQQDAEDWSIISHLLNDQDQRPWSVAELIRETGDELNAIDAIGRLARSGLIHRTSDDLIYPSRAALHLHRITRSNKARRLRPSSPLMLDPDSDDRFDDDDCLVDVEVEPIFDQWRTERWLMAILLWPAKAPRTHLVEKLTWIAGSQANLGAVLAALEDDGLIQRNGNTVSATRAAVSFWRLEMRQTRSLR